MAKTSRTRTELRAAQLELHATRSQANSLSEKNKEVRVENALLKVRRLRRQRQRHGRCAGGLFCNPSAPIRAPLPVSNPLLPAPAPARLPQEKVTALERVDLEEAQESEVKKHFTRHSLRMAETY